MLFVVALLVCAGISFALGRSRAYSASRQLGGIRHLHSLPNYYGWYVMWLTILPLILLWLFWLASESWIIERLTLAHFSTLFPLEDTGTTKDLLYARISSLERTGNESLRYFPQLEESRTYYEKLKTNSLLIKHTLAVSFLGLGIWFSLRQVNAKFKARKYVEQVITALLALSSTIAILTTLGIILSVLFESLIFFSKVPISEFLFGTHWSPQIAIRADQQGASGSFGAVPLFAGTFLITLIAMFVAAPVGLFSAIYLAEYAPAKVRSYVKPMMEILAGIPTVVYGFFAALIIAPNIRSIAESLGSQSVSSESALAAGLVMGVMIIPFVSSLSDDVIRAVPQSLRDASLAMGATRSETIKKIVLPAALPGIVGGLLLAVSRAIGETMIVVMAAGLAANLTANPLESVTTITVQIVTLLVGDQEFDSVKTLAAFALGLTLFAVTLCLNVVALYIVKKYREQYE